MALATTEKPEILAPAGNTSSFLAAMAAGADAIYLGLKNFSARMEAENFNLLELSRLCELAHADNVNVYVTMNTMLKTHETQQAARLLARLENQVHCDGIIVQDLTYIELARAAGFTGNIALSTLACVTQPEGLALAARLGAKRVILPRELSIDEIKFMAANCPANLELELFIHGALCYCVSGRCYWSSYLGGKSGLRGRCVQPCRRLYHTGKNIGLEGVKQKSKGKEARFFACQDLSLDVLVKTLLDIKELKSWKIEGRKKGPHYVYHTVLAYRMLRDYPNDPQAKRDALEILDFALGRPSTHARFLPQKERIPTDPEGNTSSGLVIGYIKREGSKCLLKPRINLLPQDYLRIGNEEDSFHQTFRVTKPMLKGKIETLRLTKQPPAQTLVFLLDRRDPRLVQLLRKYQGKLKQIKGQETKPCEVQLPRMQPPVYTRRHDIKVLAKLPVGKENKTSAGTMLGLWLSAKALSISRPVARRVYFWLAPVTWPNEAEKTAKIIAKLWQDGCRHFVLNSLWQREFFPKDLPKDADLVAGPFCNLANPLALNIVHNLGCKAAFISPELAKDDLLKLPHLSPIPLGFIISGYWPVGISRFGLLAVKENMPFASPKGEIFWAKQYGENVWLYSAWPLDFSTKQTELQQAGYSFFASLNEILPKDLPRVQRQGLFNYEGQLL